MLDKSPSGIMALIGQGESSSVEFKAGPVPTSTLLRYMTAMANSGGGVILFGVGDNGNILGLSDKQASVINSRLRSLGRAIPSLFSRGFVRTEKVIVEGKTVVVAEIGTSQNPLAHARFEQERELQRQWTKFTIETTLLLLALACFWYLATFPWIVSSPFGAILRPLTLLHPALAFGMFVAAISSFLALIFYGTAYEVTPLKILSAVFLPFVRYFKRARLIARSDELELIVPPDVPRVKDQDVAQLESLGKAVGNTEAANESGKTSTEDSTSQPQPDQESDLKESQVETLFREVSERASFLADRMQRRTNVFMIVGVGMGFLGMWFWYWIFSHAFTKATGLAEFVEIALPRITILLFIELLAGFFLRQYRIGVEDFKYFFEIEHRADWRRISYSILATAKNDAAIGALATSLACDSAPTKLAAGESTPTLEALKAESNVMLEAIKLMSSTVRDLANAIKK